MRCLHVYIRPLKTIVSAGPFDVCPEVTEMNTPSTPSTFGSTGPLRNSYYTQPAARPRPHVGNVNSNGVRPHSKYMSMLLALDEIPASHSIIAGFFVWILLAGFMVFPATFANFETDAEKGQTGVVQSAVLGVVKHVPLFIIASCCSGIGAIGMCWFWYRWRSNYVWLISNIFLHGALNSLAGVISTLASIYGAKNKIAFAGTSKLTMIVTSAATATCGLLALAFKFIVVRNLRKQHERIHGKTLAGSHGQGLYV